MYEERVMLLAGRSDKLINEDKFHLGDEVLFSAHSSPMVPKDSPIKVLSKTEKRSKFCNINIALESFGQKPWMDERHRDHPGDVLLLQDCVAFCGS